MDERVVQARVGILVVSALLLTAILIVLFGDFPTPFQRGKTVDITFPSAPGVMEGTPVRKSGILIGRVDDVQFAEDSSDVEVKVRLNEGVELRKNEVPQISSGSLLGDAVVEFVPGEEPSTELIEDGADLQGVSAGNPLDMMANLEGDVRQTLGSMATAGDEVTKLAQRVNKVMGEQDVDQVQQIMDKTEEALDRFNNTMKNLGEILSEDDQQRLRDSIRQLPDVIDETRDTMASIREVGEAAERNLQNLEGLTGPLGERGAVITERVESGISQFDTAMAQLVEFTEQVNQNEGTLGQLLNNPALYNNINTAAENISTLSSDLRPIVNDVRVFTDKIARDPGQLGVRGALQRDRGRTKYPNFKYYEPPLHWQEELRPPSDWRTGK